MSGDQQIAVPVNRPGDFSAEQPSKDDAAAAASCPVQPPKDVATSCAVQSPNDEVEMSDVIMSSKDDDAASFVPPPNDEAEMSSKDDDAACLVPTPNDNAEMSDVVLSAKEDDAISPAPPPNNDAGPSSSPNIDAGTAPPSTDDAAHTSGKTDALTPKIEPGFSNVKGYNAGVQLKEEIKHETIDLGNDTYFYDDNNKAILVKGSPKIGFDRGLEPDHIVGATEVDGKLMFLIAWKNSEVADLLESTVVYDKCPQIAIQFFEARLRYCPNPNKN